MLNKKKLSYRHSGQKEASMQAIVLLELSSPHNLTPDEMRKDISLTENEIGWAYDYKIKSIEIIES